jgi:hypothetical protein
MIGFDMHMAGLSKEISKLVAYQGKNAVAYKNLLVVGNGDFASIAKVDNHYYMIIQTKMHQTAILLDDGGYGFIPCSTNNVTMLYELEGSAFLEGREIIHAVSIEEAYTTWDIPHALYCLEKAWFELDKRTYGYTSSGAALLGMTEEDYNEHFTEVQQWILGFVSLVNNAA